MLRAGNDCFGGKYYRPSVGPRELLVTVFVENKKCACFTSSMELLSSKAPPDAILVF